MSRVLSNIPNTDAPNSDYPAGKIRNKDVNSSPAVVGSPVVEEIYGDMIQFFQKLLALATIAPNNLPDNESNGYQLVQALLFQINTAINTAKASLVDSAPGTLDTLNKLAAAINDDANFAATVTAALGNKVNTNDSRLSGLIDTGDSAAWDFSLGATELNVTTHILDLSGKVSSTAKFVLLRVIIGAGSGGGWKFWVRKHGNVNEYNIDSLDVAANGTATANFWVALSEDKKIDYRGGSFFDTTPMASILVRAYY